MPERELDNLMLRYLDGIVTPDEVDAMNQQLQQETEAQDRFIELTLRYALLHDALQGMDSRQEPVNREPTFTPTLRSRFSRGRSVWYALAASLMLVAGIATYVLVSNPSTGFNPRASHGIALLTNATGAVFADGSRQPEIGAELNAGTLSLLSGSAQVMFSTGAVVDLRGPCTFAMTEPNRGHLFSGTLEVYVPDTAHGFTITAPHDVRVIDLGTRFIMQVDSDGVSDVRVLKGTVMVEVDRPDSEKRYALLTADQRVRVDPALSVAETLRIIERPPLTAAIDQAGLRIDFQLDAENCSVPDRFTAMGMPIEKLDKVDLPLTQSLNSPLSASGQITISVDTEDSSALDFRRRTDSTDPLLGRLLEDQIKNQNSGLVVTLSNLSAGTYRMVSWHHDCDLGAAGNVFEVHVSDALGAQRLVLVDQIVSTGPSAAAPTVADFDIVADGEHPVTIIYSPTSEDRETPCNGLTLTRLDEPRVSSAQQP
ncbi:hypothetical protein HED60_04170 [Planctomycetales bacterium ZRK34]|nr:hypothetical protein HED60_04170 [Planctomycetales bacterium ZRK34]